MGSVYKGARLKWVEKRKRQKEKPLLLRDLRVHEVANRRNEGVECKGVGGRTGEQETKLSAFVSTNQKLYFSLFLSFYTYFSSFFFPSFLLVRVKRNPFYSGL
jgi:hypothetical protein